MDQSERPVPVSSREVWEVFLKRYCWEQILELANSYPDDKSLTVEFNDLERFDMDIADELLDRPDEVLEHATQSLHEMDIPADVELTGAYVRIQHLPRLTPIKDIRSANINKLIAVTGLIKKATEVRPRLLNAAFKCARCQHVMRVSQEDRYTEPFE